MLQSMLQSMRTSWDRVAFKDRVEAARATAATTGEATEVGINDIVPFGPEFFAAFEQLKVDGGTRRMSAYAVSWRSPWGSDRSTHPDPASGS